MKNIVSIQSSILSLFLCAVLVSCGSTKGGSTGSGGGGGSSTSVATPTFSPAAGSILASQKISIADETAGAAIFYTTDGSDPTTGSTPYTQPISLSASATVKAIATASGVTSATGQAAYVIVSPPSFVQAVYLTCGFSSGAQQSCILPDGTFQEYPLDLGSTAVAPGGGGEAPCITMKNPGDQLLIFTFSTPIQSYVWINEAVPDFSSFSMVNQSGNVSIFNSDSIVTQANSEYPWLVHAILVIGQSEPVACMNFTFPPYVSSEIAQFGVVILEYQNITGFDSVSVGATWASGVTENAISNSNLILSQPNETVVSFILANGVTVLAGSGQIQRLSVSGFINAPINLGPSSFLVEDSDVSAQGSYSPQAYVNSPPSSSAFLSVGLIPTAASNATHAEKR